MRSQLNHPHLRRVGIALLFPFKMAVESGHSRSALRLRAQDRDGRPIPWYTYPVIDFLEGHDFSSRQVLEFGGGQSTLWWARRAAGVHTIEDNPAWFSDLEASAQALPGVTCTLRQDPGEYAREPLGRSFDVVVIDGGDRVLCAQTAADVVTPGGAIILDNSEGFWSPTEEYPIVTFLQSRGYRRVDFHGYAAGVWHQQCTSIFFQPDSWLFADLPPPRRRYAISA